ncbi:hypothetical protein B9Z55_024302 [Caenorhabditis nigoni]|uniref:Secreted protein n=1 Tax=Caenorhabditis nigoni TaxID=1611254 RepID=A0A2G5STY5_9PELO|nr:hypothetical protein B9Z55_024302 [Caenorhabditis nigoni]
MKQFFFLKNAFFQFFFSVFIVMLNAKRASQRNKTNFSERRCVCDQTTALRCFGDVRKKNHNTVFCISIDDVDSFSVSGFYNYGLIAL